MLGNWGRSEADSSNLLVELEEAKKRRRNPGRLLRGRGIRGTGGWQPRGAGLVDSRSPIHTAMIFDSMRIRFQGGQRIRGGSPGKAWQKTGKRVFARKNGKDALKTMFIVASTLEGEMA